MADKCQLSTQKWLLLVPRHCDSIYGFWLQQVRSREKLCLHLSSLPRKLWAVLSLCLYEIHVCLPVNLASGKASHHSQQFVRIWLLNVFFNRAVKQILHHGNLQSAKARWSFVLVFVVFLVGSPGNPEMIFVEMHWNLVLMFLWVINWK